MYNWSDIHLEALQGINLSYYIAKLNNWQDDIEYRSTVRNNEKRRYEQIMTHIESNWSAYGDQAQQMYDAATYCYLKLGGKMIGVDIDDEILRLAKIVYRMEN